MPWRCGAGVPAPVGREGGKAMGTVAGTILDWRNEWHEFEGMTYLNLAGQSPVPKVAINR